MQLLHHSFFFSENVKSLFISELTYFGRYYILPLPWHNSGDIRAWGDVAVVLHGC